MVIPPNHGKDAAYYFVMQDYEHPGVRDAALVFGIGHREYCDRFVRDNFPPLTWTSASADNWQPDSDAAYRSSGEG